MLGFHKASLKEMGDAQSVHAADVKCNITCIDESVFSEDVMAVSDCIMKMMRAGAVRKSPFKYWTATGSPCYDLTWLAFGFHASTESYDCGTSHAYYTAY